MTQTETERTPVKDATKYATKDAMKALRAERAQWVGPATAQAAENRKARKAIRASLAQASATVPEIAAAVGLAPDTALWLLASMKKFGEVVEADKAGSYYRYALAAQVPESGEG